MVRTYFKLVAFFLLFILTNQGFAQKQVSESGHLWLGYFNQTRLTNKFGTWTDIHYRRSHNLISHPFQFIGRAGLTYYISNNVRATVGYGYIRHYEEGTVPARNEHRPWQQLWWKQDYVGFTTTQYLRLEERYREKVYLGEVIDGYSFNFRLRYNFSFFVPLKGKKIVAKTPFVALIDEVFLNFGKEVKNYYDQNRFFVGLGYQFNTHTNIQFGYMNLFQQLPAPDKYNNVHAMRLFLFHNLDLRKAESQ